MAGFIDLAAILRGGMTSDGAATASYTPIQFPIDIPSGLLMQGGIRDLVWQYESVQAISQSPFTFHEQIQRHSGERWGVSVVLSKMSQENSGQWQGFLLQLDGMYRDVLFGDVFNPSPKGVATGTPRLNGTNSGKVINTDGWTVSTENILKAGDWIQVNNQLLKVTRNTNSNSNGESTVDVWPSIRGASDNDTIITENARGLFRLAKPTGALYSSSIIRTVNDMPAFNLVESIGYAS